MEVTGVMAVGEGAAALAYIKARWGLSPRQRYAILMICMLAIGLPFGVWASGSWSAAIGAVEAVFIGLMLGALIIRMLAGPSMRRALAARGQASALAATLRLTPDTLVYDLADVTITARWPCVTDLYRTRKHWVFLVQSSAIVLPRRFFPNPDAERDFISMATSRMTEAARVRSPDAVRAAS